MDNRFVSMEKVVNWFALREYVCQKLDREYSINYIQGVWKGRQTNHPLNDLLTDLIGEYDGKS